MAASLAPTMLSDAGSGPDLRCLLAPMAELAVQGAHALVCRKLEGHVRHILQQRGQVACEQTPGTCTRLTV